MCKYGEKKRLKITLMWKSSNQTKTAIDYYNKSILYTIYEARIHDTIQCWYRKFLKFKIWHGLETSIKN